MKYTDLLKLWPLLKPFTSTCLQPLLSALVSGAEEVAAAEARRIARSRQTAQTAGAAAKASSDSTTKAREQGAGAAAARASAAQAAKRAAVIDELRAVVKAGVNPCHSCLFECSAEKLECMQCSAHKRNMWRPKT